ncbi:MAG: argininosuccinate lyase, partial [Planctomycetes bacterium]|nr:argininosuccinate lyase [Planctomycetota bacterium]
SVAHAQMLSEQGLISREDFRQIKSGFAKIAAQIEADEFQFDLKEEDIHMALEAALIREIGEPGKKLHTGRSRNDQVSLDTRLWTRDQIMNLSDLIQQLQAELVKLAGKDGDLVMPGYTHLQRAQPVTVGSGLLAVVEQLERDRERFADGYKRVNVCPLGAGALAGSSLNLNRERVAELLGFASITQNSIDTVSDRDFCVEFVFDCSMAAMHLSRWAEEWILYSSSEFGFITIDDAYCTGSSMMPQKRNPDMLELIRGKSGGVYGNLVAMLTMLKGLPPGYNRDMQEDKKQLFDAADTLGACLSMAAGIVKHTRFNPSRLSAALEDGFMDATALAEYLVRKGVAFRQAHQVVGRLVQTCETAGKTLSQLELKEMQKVCPEVERDVYESLTSINVAKGYVTAAAAGNKQLIEQLAAWKKKLEL